MLARYTLVFIGKKVTWGEAIRKKGHVCDKGDTPSCIKKRTLVYEGQKKEKRNETRVETKKLSREITYKSRVCNNTLCV